LPITVAAAGSCTVNVAFNSTVPAGVKNGTLSIASNDPLNPLVTVNLSGTAVAPVTVTAAVSAGSPAGSGTISPSGAVSVVPGTSQAFAISPAAGYHITDVTVNGVSKGTPYSVILPVGNSGGTITASFARNTYTVTASGGSGGGVAGPSFANHGDLKTYTFTPNPGYHVADVKVDDKSVGAVTTLTLPVIANTAVTATFAINTYTVTRNAGAGGTITGPAAAKHGDAPTYAIAPNPGHHITDVKVDGVSKGAVTAVTLQPVTADVTVAATFAVNVLIADGDANNDGKVDVADALKALRVAVGLETVSPAEYVHCDVAPLDANGMPAPDKQITVADALIILRKVIGLTSGW
jgi:hypothetical protein